MNDVLETFLMQCHISGFEECTPKNLRKLVVDYASMNCDTLKVTSEYCTLSQFCKKPNFLITTIKSTAAYLNIFICQQENLSTNLSMRDLTFENYVQKLAEQKTNGYDLALKILTEMFCVSIIVLFEKYLWKSEEKPLEEFDLYLMLFAQGRFMSASRIDKKKLIVQIPKCLSSSISGLRSASMNGDIPDEPINLSRAKLTLDAAPMPPPTTIDMSVAESTKSALGKYFKGYISFVKNIHKLTIYATPKYKFCVK